MIFAAAATVGATILGLSKSIAKFVAIKALLIALIVIVLPWILKGFYLSVFDHIMAFIEPMIQAMISQITGLTGGVYDFNLQLTGVGGYIAEQIGLIEYCSIIFSGWAAYLAIVTLRKFTPWI